MWILIGQRRINMGLVKEYKPSERESFDKKIYSIMMVYSNNEREEIYFGQDQKTMIEHLRKMDEKTGL